MPEPDEAEAARASEPPVVDEDEERKKAILGRLMGKAGDADGDEEGGVE